MNAKGKPRYKFEDIREFYVRRLWLHNHMAPNGIDKPEPFYILSEEDYVYLKQRELRLTPKQAQRLRDFIAGYKKAPKARRWP